MKKIIRVEITSDPETKTDTVTVIPQKGLSTVQVVGYLEIAKLTHLDGKSV